MNKRISKKYGNLVTRHVGKRYAKLTHTNRRSTNRYLRGILYKYLYCECIDAGILPNERHVWSATHDMLVNLSGDEIMHRVTSALHYFRLRAELKDST